MLNYIETITGIILHCIKSEYFIVGYVSNSVGTVFRPGEVCYTIEKLAVNTACGLDHVTAEHLKYGASHRISVLLAVCFTGLLMHGTLPGSMLCVMLVPVVKNQTGK